MKKPLVRGVHYIPAVEQDADFVIGCYRDEYYVAKGIWKPRFDGDIAAGPNTFEARILKNRHGGETAVLLWCDMPHNIITDEHR